MGNEFIINKRTMTITPLRSRTEAISKIPTPKPAKQCKSFCGVVNYLSLFYPDLQTLLKPIVELTRKGRSFVWGPEQDKAFKEVKSRLTSPPVLHLPKAEGRFILYSDISIEGTVSSLWQMQGGKARLLGYASKTLPEACSRYSVTELEMTGLLVNMNLWKNLLKDREFDAAVDHVAVTQIMKAKTEPATTRIMRLLDRLSAYSFNLYYFKGRCMILADYQEKSLVHGLRQLLIHDLYSALPELNPDYRIQGDEPAESPPLSSEDEKEVKREKRGIGAIFSSVCQD